MTLPPASHRLTRVITTLITSTIWWLILYGTGWTFVGGSKVVHATPLAMGNTTAISFMFIPYFATHGLLMSMLDGFLKGRIILPEPAQTASPGGVANAWRLGVINALLFGLVPACIGYVVASGAAADTLTPGAFAVRYAFAGALLCACVTWYSSGQPFLRATRVPREKRAFAGTPDQYLWRHFVLPHGLANAVINGVLAFALSPVPFADADAIVPARHIVVDTVAAFLILTWLISSGTKTQARVETQFGIAPAAAASQSGVPTAFLTALFASLGFSIAVGAIFWFTKTPGLDVFSWAAFRAVVFGVYAGWLSKGVAQAAINGVVNPEPSATPASSQAA